VIPLSGQVGHNILRLAGETKEMGHYIRFYTGGNNNSHPDPVNQTLVAVPLIVLYEASIWLAKLVERKQTFKQAL